MKIAHLEKLSKWKYCGIVGILEYLQGTSCPDISMSTHQCARSNNDPKPSHERAVKQSVRYLLDTLEVTKE
jgi:hypothetical protein